MFKLNLETLVVNLVNLRLVLILLVNSFFVFLMIKKKISTILALPLMGICTALISTIGVLPGLGLFNMVTGVDKDGEDILKSGIFNGVIMDGAKMLSGAIVATVFGAAFSKLLTKSFVVETLIKKAAELAGNRPLIIALVFFVATAAIFSSIGGLGAVILVGSITLPIMISVGLGEVLSGTIILLGLSAGGLINPANFATYAAVLSPTMNNDYTAAYNTVSRMSLTIFVIVFIVSIIFIIFSSRKFVFQKNWARQNLDTKHKVEWYALIAPIIPVVLVIVSVSLKVTLPPEVAILFGIIYLLLVIKHEQKLNLLTSSFVEGTQEVAGAIVLLIGLGILLKGFQFFTVSKIITPFISYLISFLQNPLTYVVGFTLATPLVLYRGPLNTFGIGGALPVIFAQAGFSPVAIIWVLIATGNMQGFGDPTNSQNIWISNFVKVDPNEITKKVFFLGIIITFIILVYAVVVNNINLGV